MAKILIVDDAVFIRQRLSNLLKKEGFEIAGEAENGKDAIEKYKELKPDLVTMDIIMPNIQEIDGIAAVKEIMEIDPQAKIIIVSAVGQRALMLEAIQAGAKDFIVKPYLASEVVKVIRRVLEQGI